MSKQREALHAAGSYNVKSSLWADWLSVIFLHCAGMTAPLTIVPTSASDETHKMSVEKRQNQDECE